VIRTQDTPGIFGIPPAAVSLRCGPLQQIVRRGGRIRMRARKLPQPATGPPMPATRDRDEGDTGFVFLPDAAAPTGAGPHALGPGKAACTAKVAAGIDR